MSPAAAVAAANRGLSQLPSTTKDAQTSRSTAQTKNDIQDTRRPPEQGANADSTSRDRATRCGDSSGLRLWLAKATVPPSQNAQATQGSKHAAPGARRASSASAQQLQPQQLQPLCPSPGRPASCRLPTSRGRAPPRPCKGGPSPGGPGQGPPPRARPPRGPGGGPGEGPRGGGRAGHPPGGAPGAPAIPATILATILPTILK